SAAAASGRSSCRSPEPRRRAGGAGCPRSRSERRGETRRAHPAARGHEPRAPSPRERARPTREAGVGRGRSAAGATGRVPLAGGAARAQEPAPVASDVALSQEDRIRELERTVQGLTEELARTRVELAVPENSASLTSQWGYGPAASKVYERDRGLSIGGYAEGRYTAFVNNKGDESNTADLERAVLYTSYKFNDHLVFNSEIEFEHASTEQTVTTSLGGQEGGS